VATLTEGAKNAAAASLAPLTSAPAGASSAPFGIQVPSMVWRRVYMVQVLDEGLTV